MIRAIGAAAASIIVLIVAGGIFAAVGVMRSVHPPAPRALPEMRLPGPPPPMPVPPHALGLLAILVVTLVLCAAVAAAAWALAAALSRNAFVPLEQTTAALEALAAGDFSKRVIAVEGNDRVTQLARAYNEAAEAVASAFDERRAAARELQRFLADAGHELRTPLTIVSGYIDILRDSASMDAQTFQRVVENMRTESARMRRLVEKMLLLARIESVRENATEVDVDELARETAASIGSRYPARTISVSGSTNARIRADESDVAEALSNVIENAVRYAPESEIDIELSGDDTSACIAVIDCGPGVAPAEREMIFDRFYRGEGRGATEGAGLGLAIARTAAERWGGTLTLAGDRARTRFVFRFPRNGAA